MRKILPFLTGVCFSLFADQFSLIQEQLRQAEAEFKRAQQTYMTGNWDGWRYKLADKGVTFLGSFQTDMIGNPIGGVSQGFTYVGSFGLGVDVDFEAAAGITGFELFASAVWRTGTSLSKTKIGNQFPVQQAYGSQTVKLNELFLKETLFDGRLVMKAGRLDAGNDFLQSDLFYQFVNNSFCGNPISIFFNIPFSAYPNATWGSYLSFAPIQQLNCKFAIYNANTKIFQNKYHGVNFTFKSTNGVTLVSELHGSVNQEEDSKGMQGNYKVGFIYLTGNTQKFSNGLVHGDYCIYLLADHMIYRPGNGRGLTPFVSVLIAPKDRNLFPVFYDIGMVWQGPFTSRPKDIAALGFSYGKYSSDLAKEEQDEGDPTQNFEAVVEWNYAFQINDWLQITPDFQYIIHPRGLDIPDAFCLGTQITINL